MDHYARLGISKGADANEVRRAYMKLARSSHPDKGGDAEEFKQIQKAYEVLSDDERRAMYDATGRDEEGSGSGGPGGMPFSGGFPFPFDIGGMFGMFGPGGPGGGGGGGGGGGPPQKKGPKGPPKVHEMPLSLWDFYHGKCVHIQFERQKFCSSCKGSGAESWESCGGCGGSGVRQQILMMGPMQAISRGPCPDCNGKGKRMRNQCGTCSGKKFVSEHKGLDVIITPGMRPGEILKFTGECSDQEEYDAPGDVHIVLLDADSDVPFRRAGSDDLAVRLTVTLQKALCGSSETVQGHPGHSQGLVIQIPAGVQNGETFVIENEGMPKKSVGASPSRGRLFVTVDVRITETEKEILQRKRDLIQMLFL